MHRNEAIQWAQNEQVNDVNVDTRIGRFESDLGHVKKAVAQTAENVGKLQEGLAVANKATADLRVELVNAKAELSSRITAEVEGLRKETKAEFAKVREEIGAVRQEIGAVRQEVGAVRQEIGAVREEVQGIKATLPHLATTAELNRLVLGLKAEMQAQWHRMETQMIRWFIFTSLGAASLAFTIAKVVN
jgi:septal ring factor EnvC (AmiA/AmiB activator)